MRSFLRSPLGIALLVAIVVWLLEIGEPLGHAYWNITDKLIVARSAPTDIVVVDADGLAETGAQGMADLFDAVSAAHPSRLYIDTGLQGGSTRDGLAIMRAAIARLDPATTFVVRSESASKANGEGFHIPERALIGNHPVVASRFDCNFLFYATSSPYQFSIGGARYPALAVALAGVNPNRTGRFELDQGMDPATIVRVSARSLLGHQEPLAQLAGRQVIITTSDRGMQYGYFGHGQTRGVLFDIAGAVQLRHPLPVGVGELPLLAIAAGLIALARRRQNSTRRTRLHGAAVAVVLLAPVVVRGVGIVAPPDSAISLLIIYGAIRLWQKRTRAIRHTSALGLPNLLALSNSDLPVGSDVVVASIARFEEILATLPRELHGECAQQIARRITVGCGADQIYHSDGGHFAWVEEARPLDMQLSHLEGLRALFAAPLQVGAHTFDTNIHFGLDRNEGAEATTRVNSALASANDALANGRSIELFEAHRLAEAPWELSLHARIDEGLRNGDIWLAFQPQWDLATNRICGAEALIRWNHPTRGAIATNAFILQAERAGRIDSLTYWVLDQAITAAIAINAKGERFQMSVNLSAQMVDKPDLVANFGRIVARRGVDPQLITVEVTETSSVGNRAAAVHNLTQLRDMGFRLSIDDFGTGEASLAYLSDLPSDELKLDRRFVGRILENPRDRAIVASTIGLAHALGQMVVAEGIEDAATLAMLRDMGCDLAQGYLLGYPQPFARFEADYDASRRRQFGSV